MLWPDRRSCRRGISVGAPHRASFHQSFWITLIFMVISIIRSYLVRRFFAVYVTRFAA
ncbi:hypothetical protein M2222_001351 [Bradyrhizobium elkanii]|uniref:DUF7220 family protein n=1 Tax=Bradyrhizobium elkanii TaxID=29448 RepID=UPI00216A56B9|nr:hypothetical protein [Bradyrhizobium elkanii]MCS3449828.1 hypothetical protein [Bradyrhizobium elkanii]MCS3559029.1 hypothetical protein [Bradyrhizobium elkanii]MCW2151125.1 hypothetical protein [Bradyrhizobium elkanii]MCW2374856.1 hypothetical protein [Bradyrhizobium elkanii]